MFCFVGFTVMVCMDVPPEYSPSERDSGFTEITGAWAKDNAATSMLQHKKIKAFMA